MSDSAETYQVLARKYRPRTFEDMIGQDAMVTTLKNAFEVGRVAHAFMMTGVRGIGKTTTARLLARALNYESDTVDGPSVDLSANGKHCELIMASQHMDVLEMDAASRTGVDNMRELLDGVRYAPATARYKVYIIDEVHMLSAGAFNALLKTLEEPPDHAKFIFATTEIRKVPITVLSRCQRFDLRRVESTVLAQHLRGIADKEKVAIDDGALALIARAAEGSVRDGLSLLDQAIVQGGLDGVQVDAEQVRTMLGLADRVRILDLFDHAASGRTKDALLELRSQYDDGADPAVVMRDLLDVCHDISRAKTLGEDAAFDAAPDQITRMRDIAAEQSVGQLTRFWQVLMTAYNEVRLAPAPLAAAEMALLKFGLAGQMPPPEMAAALLEAAQKNQAEGGPGLPQITGSPSPAMSQAMPQQHSSPSGASASTVTALSPPKPIAQADPSIAITSLAEFADAISQSEPILKLDIERYVHLVSFKRGRIELRIGDPRKQDIIGRMVKALQDLTGDLWIVSPVEAEGDPTLRDQKKSAATAQDIEDRSHPAFAHPLLDGAELIEVKPRAAKIIQKDFRPPHLRGDDEKDTP